MKTCSKCLVSKPLSEFNKHPTSLGGYLGKCKSCIKEYKKSYLNSSHGKETVAAYRKSKKAMDYLASDKKKESSAKYRKSEKAQTLVKAYRKTDEYKAVRRTQRLKRIKQILLSSAKRRANIKGLQFSITVADIVIPDKCPLLGIVLIAGTRKNRAASPSLDRIDNTLGYIPGNVAVISNRANSIKGNLTLDELLHFSKQITVYISGRCDVD